jgi:hypothetical protein
MSNFYEELDIVFDKLYEIYGLTDELINYKSNILVAYEKERGYRYAYTHISSKKIFVDENGYVTLMEK